MRDRAANSLLNVLKERFEIVNHPGPGILTLRVALTEVYASSVPSDRGRLTQSATRRVLDVNSIRVYSCPSEELANHARRDGLSSFFSLCRAITFASADSSIRVAERVDGY